MGIHDLFSVQVHISLQVVDVPVPDAFSAGDTPVVSFDPEWLAITRAFQPYLSVTRHQSSFPDEAQARELVDRETQWVMENVPKKLGVEAVSSPSSWRVENCQTFVTTAPGPGTEGRDRNKQRTSCSEYSPLPGTDRRIS